MSVLDANRRAYSGKLAVADGKVEASTHRVACSMRSAVAGKPRYRWPVGESVHKLISQAQVDDRGNDESEARRENGRSHDQSWIRG